MVPRGVVPLTCYWILYDGQYDSNPGGSGGNMYSQVVRDVCWLGLFESEPTLFLAADVVQKKTT